MSRWGLTSLVLACALCASLAAAGSASASSRFPADARALSVSLAKPSAVIGGTRWPGRPVAKIKYFNASEAKWAVSQGVKAWNTSGARIRFVPVPRRRAKLVIRDAPGPRSDGYVGGYATVGYVYPGGSFVQLSRLATPRKPHYNMAGVVAHELGHVLGLEHEDRRCATMNTVLWADCGGDRACRLLERDDIAGAVKMYGGRVRMKRPAFCPKPPAEPRAVSDPLAYLVTLQWRNPRGPLPSNVEVLRGKGSCPRKAPRSGALAVEGRRPGELATARDTNFGLDGRLETGRYCYSLWSVSDMGFASRRRTLWVDFSPQRPGAPTGLRGTIAPTGQVTLSWTASSHPEAEAVEGALARGRCPASPDGGEDKFSGTGSATAWVYEPGRYCVAAWTRDSVGALFGPATVWVEFAGQPPEAGFFWEPDYYGPAQTIRFYDSSWDPEGEPIASHRWDFGDGSPAASGPEVVHTYAAAGNYTVRLTVTDASGQSATATETVVVDP